MKTELDTFYGLIDEMKPVVLFELAKGWLTGERVEPGETHELRHPHR